MIPVHITAVSQEFNLRTRAQETFAMFELPNGHRFRAPVTDETASHLIRLALEEGPPAESPSLASDLPPSRPIAPPSTEVHQNGAPNGFDEGAASDGTPAFVFGGDVTTPAAQTDVMVPTITPVRPKLIGKDANGYPIMSAPGGVDPSVVTGTLGDGDEDGVRSV